VRLVDENGEQLGVKPTSEAIEYALGKDLDLVEVAAQADPPVAKVMDYGKYRYEQEQKAKLARKHQVSINVKEIKLRPKIGVHDYETKKGRVVPKDPGDTDAKAEETQRSEEAVQGDGDREAPPPQGDEESPAHQEVREAQA
jgi:translation initiation factor IF-3